MAHQYLKKTVGKDFNFFTILPVNWAQFGAPDGYTAQDGYGPDVVIPFPTQTATFVNYGSGTVEYSFNGTTVHGDMVPATPSASLTFNNRTVCMVWFRLKTGSSGPINIRVEAWAKD
jgi:hypothetical protein